MKNIEEKPLQDKCAWCKKKVINHHRLCDKCHSVKQKRLNIGKKRENVQNKSKSEEHNNREIERWNK